MSQSIRSAFEASGCILVNYDGISGDEREGLFAAMRSLFDLPVDAKRRNTDKQSLTTYPGTLPAVPLYEAQGVMNAADIDKSEAFTRLMWPQGNDKFWYVNTPLLMFIVVITDRLKGLHCSLDTLSSD